MTWILLINLQAPLKQLWAKTQLLCLISCQDATKGDPDLSAAKAKRMTWSQWYLQWEDLSQWWPIVLIHREHCYRVVADLEEVQIVYAQPILTLWLQVNNDCHKWWTSISFWGTRQKGHQDNFSSILSTEFFNFSCFFFNEVCNWANVSKTLFMIYRDGDVFLSLLSFLSSLTRHIVLDSELWLNKKHCPSTVLKAKYFLNGAKEHICWVYKNK